MISHDRFAAYRSSIATMRFESIVGGKKWDGRAIWQPMKNSLSDQPTVVSWSGKVNSAERNILMRDVLQLSETNEDGSTNELNHFLMQCVRIPVNDTPSDRKIMQLALNIGQLQAELKLIQVDERFLNLYNRFIKLNMTELSAYID